MVRHADSLRVHHTRVSVRHTLSRRDSFSGSGTGRCRARIGGTEDDKEPGDGRDLDASLKLLWGDRTRPQRGRPPTLSLDRIVAAAVEVADELALTEGLDGLSMRCIAQHLGVGTMSLYRYVPGKSELLDLMLDHVVEEYKPDPDDRRGWREILRDEARGHWRLCMEHPWYPFVDQSRPLLGPNSVRGLDRLLGLLRPTGLPDRTLMMMVGAQTDFVDGIARGSVNEMRAERRTGRTRSSGRRRPRP